MPFWNYTKFLGAQEWSNLPHEVDFAELVLRHGAVVEYRREMIFAVMARADGGLWRLPTGDGKSSDFERPP